MDTREFKGLELAARAKIEQRNTYFYVPSASHEGGYKVNNDATECSCPDFEERQLPCKHCHAVKIVKERNRGTPIPDKKEVVQPGPKPTYPQQWASYNKAQCHEKEQFLPLLAELCQGIEWTARGGTGRPSLPYDAAIFGAIYKVYSTLSGRRFQTDMRNARGRTTILASRGRNIHQHFSCTPCLAPHPQTGAAEPASSW